MRIAFLKLNELTDEQLMLRVARGSSTAFGELYNRYARRLQGFFFRRLGGDEEQAVDLTHDLFLRVFGARQRYQEGRNVSTWFFTIAYNLLKNHYRTPSSEPPDIANIEAPTIEQQMDAERFHDALQQVLGELPTDYGLIFSLHYEEELTVPQIAQITGLPEGTVKSRLHKSMNIVKQKLQAYDHR